MVFARVDPECTCSRLARPVRTGLGTGPRRRGSRNLRTQFHLEGLVAESVGPLGLEGAERHRDVPGGKRLTWRCPEAREIALTRDRRLTEFVLELVSLVSDALAGGRITCERCHSANE
jgi:hypothetical protein